MRTITASEAKTHEELRRARARRLIGIMDETADEAARRGLTPELLEELLAGES